MAENKVGPKRGCHQGNEDMTELQQRAAEDRRKKKQRMDRNRSMRGARQTEQQAGWKRRVEAIDLYWGSLCHP